MYNLLTKVIQKKNKTIVISFLNLNILNFFTGSLFSYIFIFYNLYGFSDKYFIGSFVKKKNLRFFFYNRKDISLISFLLYSPFIFTYLLF